MRSINLLATQIDSKLDLIIDDGLHSPDANIATLIFACENLKKGGWFVVEDIAPAALPLWRVISTMLPIDFRAWIISSQTELVFVMHRSEDVQSPLEFAWQRSSLSYSAHSSDSQTAIVNALNPRIDPVSRAPHPPIAASFAMSAPFARKNPPPFGFPAIERKKVVAAFDGGRLTSDGGVLLLGAVERQLGIADTLAPLISDPRNPLYVTHSVSDILRARILAIACGYEDGDDLDVLRTDPGFKVACGRLPDSGDDLCSQPTVSRWENAPSLREVVRMSYAMIDLYCRSYDRPPAAVTFDIDDTCDVVHGNQQLALFHAHYDERCFLPIHVYDAANARPVVVLLRPGKTPSGEEIRGHLRRMVRRIRRHWPHTRITIRGDCHYGRHEVMTWCEANGLHYIFGLSSNVVLEQMVEPLADAVRAQRAEAQAKLVALRRSEPPVDAGWLRRAEAHAIRWLDAAPEILGSAIGQPRIERFEDGGASTHSSRNVCGPLLRSLAVSPRCRYSPSRWPSVVIPPPISVIASPSATR